VDLYWRATKKLSIDNNTKHNRDKVLKLLPSTTDCRNQIENNALQIGRSVECIQACEYFMGKVINHHPVEIGSEHISALKTIYKAFSAEDNVVLEDLNKKVEEVNLMKKEQKHETVVWKSIFWEDALEDSMKADDTLIGLKTMKIIEHLAVYKSHLIIGGITGFVYYLLA